MTKSLPPTLPAPLSVLAVDVGYGNVKFVQRLHDGTIERKLFPALAPAYSSSTVSLHEFAAKRDTVVVEVDSNRYEVGVDVRQVIAPTNMGGDLSDEYAQTSTYKALLYGAIAYSGASSIDCLCLGLPVHIYNQEISDPTLRTKVSVAAWLKSRYIGSHFIQERKIAIKDVIVIPQPIGTLFWHKQKQIELGQPLGEINLMIDPGFFSTDWVVAYGWKTMDQRSGGRRGGVSEIYRRVAAELSHTLGEQFTDIWRIDEAIRANKPLLVYGNSYELQPFLKSAEPVIAEVIKGIKSSIQTSTDISSVLITGGGASLFKGEVAASFSKNQVRVLDDGVFANAKGFLLAGETKLGKAPRGQASRS